MPIVSSVVDTWLLAKEFLMIIWRRSSTHVDAPARQDVNTHHALTHGVGGVEVLYTGRL